MDKIRFEDFRKETSKRSKELDIIHLQSPAGRAIRTKPRDPAELEALIRLTLNRKAQALNSGEYEIISPRRWIIHEKNPKTTEARR